VNLLILVVDDEPDVEILFRQQFRRDLRAERFAMDFAQSGAEALEKIGNAGDASPPMAMPRPSAKHWNVVPTHF